MSDNDVPNDGTKKALIISISDYENLPALPFCKNDGQEMSNLLKSLGYEIKEEHNLIGKVSKEQIENAVDTFFTEERVRRKDLLLFYYSGHGIPEATGEHYIASSETEISYPWREGYSFEELSDMIDRSNSERKVVILDCCYSGSADLGKGTETASVAAGMVAVDNKIKAGYGKCILAACRGTQESFGRTEGDNSQFTYYLLEGLHGGKGESVDEDGNVTPEKLSNYVIDKLDALPPNERPQQRPIRKIEASGDIVLVNYPDLALSKPPTGTYTTDNSKETILGMIEYVEKVESSDIGKHHHTMRIPFAIFFTTDRVIIAFTGGTASATDPTKWNVKLGIFMPHPEERANKLSTMDPDDILQSEDENVSIPYNVINSITIKKGWLLSMPSIEIMANDKTYHYFFVKEQFAEYVRIVKNAFPDRLIVK